MKKFLLLSLGLFALAACAADTEGYSPRPFNFAIQAPQRINVAQVKLVDAYRPPLTPPNVEQDFPTPPAKAAGMWVSQRLIATGQQGILEVTIDDASVRESKLPIDKSMMSFFQDQQSDKLDARLHASLKLYNGTDTMAVASGDITVTRSVTVNEKASVTDREKIYDDMIEAMMTDFNGQAQDRLHTYFAAYLL